MRHFLLGLLALTVPLLAQRPKTAGEAVERLQRVLDRPEAERQRAASDLGDFADADATALLLAELQRAQGLGYRQTIVRALGAKPRPGAVEPLAAQLATSTTPRLSDAIAGALCQQGEPGIRALATHLSGEPGPRRQPICDALGRSDTELARATLLQELQRANKRDRLPPLRALRRAKASDVDAVRVGLATDADPLVAATALLQLGEHGHADAPALALELSRRAPGDAAADIATAVSAGLLVAPQVAAHHEPLLVAAAAAEDPFHPRAQPRWTAAMADAGCRGFFSAAAPKRKAARERAVAAQALGFAAADGRAGAAAVLGKLLLDREPMVVAAASGALAGFGEELASGPLQAALQGGGETQVPLALHALAQLRGAALLPELLQQGRGKSVAGRAAAMQLLAASPPADPAPVIALAGENLLHKAWPVRSAAIDLLRELRQAAGVPLLFLRLEAEDGRLRQDLVAALRELTALQFPTVADWQAWWQKEGPTFRVVDKPKADDRPRRRGERGDRGGDSDGSGGRAPAGTVSYWDLPVHSDRVAFVVDTSGSMAQPFGTGDAIRLDEAKRQLLRVLGLMPKTAKANVIAFGGEAKAMGSKLEALSPARQQAAATFVGALEPKGPTNVHDALWLAFADPEVDTIFLLTDGFPSAGPVVDTKALLSAVQRWNLGRSLRIHTVALGGRSDFLAQLAEQSGGNHTVAR